jgi:hypothetical protein
MKKREKEWPPHMNSEEHGGITSTFLVSSLQLFNILVNL